jgi:hypothetical protein
MGAEGEGKSRDGGVGESGETPECPSFRDRRTLCLHYNLLGHALSRGSSSSSKPHIVGSRVNLTIAIGSL